jgi:hypothetical protein|tara:strand:+ start:94 stop:444 length:351 start_codon:yes stop_codon:yes gene_type:complete
MQYIYNTPIAAIKAAAKFEAQGLIVTMSTATVEELWGIEQDDRVLVLDVAEPAPQVSPHAEVHASLSRLRAVLAQPLLSDAERELLRIADARNVAACIRAEREARIPKPDADGWEF